MDYDISPRGYLARARERLLEAEHASLFYAALELRCFVEARQDQYVDAQREYVRSIPKAWNIGAQGKALHAIFDSDRIQRLRWEYDDHEVAYDVCHVPVSSALRNGAERLDQYRHAQSKWRAPDDPWWDEMRAQVVAVYREAWLCAQGRLLSPAFLKEKRIVGSVIIEMVSDEERNALAGEHRVGATGLLHVDYFDAPPADWVPDIDK